MNKQTLQEDWEKELFSIAPNLNSKQILKLKYLIRSTVAKAKQQGRDEAVDYVNTNLMWGRSEDKKYLEILPSHIHEVLEKARTPKQ